ncbi:hypothetical protein [Kistimonas asteriae]|uniref:hypothetical protein n=1 Tax=Kistimonas asteriae TaxID=517724 RepID=UPI001BA82D3C|nr:hypothetical protein [Kistimonas asteriae]
MNSQVVEWVMDARKRGPEYMIYLLLLSGAGINVVQTDKVEEKLSAVIETLGENKTRLTVMEYRMNRVDGSK